MKILGKTPHGFILDATDDEVANIVGHYSLSSVGGWKYLGTGDVIMVSSMFMQLYRLAQAQKQVETVRTTLRSVADLLELSDPVIKAVIEEPAQPNPQGSAGSLTSGGSQ